jgi:hypothetical protein
MHQARLHFSQRIYIQRATTPTENILHERALVSGQHAQSRTAVLASSRARLTQPHLGTKGNRGITVMVWTAPLFDDVFDNNHPGTAHTRKMP